MKLNKLNIAIVGLSGMLSAPAFAQNFYQCMPIGCKPGYYGAPGACTPCPAGEYSDTSNSTVCKKCPPGTYSLVRSTSCDKCPLGQFGDPKKQCFEKRNYIGFGGGSGLKIANSSGNDLIDWFVFSLRVGQLPVKIQSYSFKQHPGDDMSYWHFYDKNCFPSQFVNQKTSCLEDDAQLCYNITGGETLIQWNVQETLKKTTSVKEFDNPFSENGQIQDRYVVARETENGTQVLFMKNCIKKGDHNIDCDAYKSANQYSYKDPSQSSACMVCEILNSYIVEGMEVQCEY